MSGLGAREPTTWQQPADSDTDEENDAGDDGDASQNLDEDASDEEGENENGGNDDDDDDDDDDDEQGVTKRRIAWSLARLIEENSHTQSGADAIAAFQRYSLQSETNDVRMIEFSDLQIPAEHLTRLLDPISSDARTRAYFRGVSEEIDKKAVSFVSGGDYAQMAAQLIFGIVYRVTARETASGAHPIRYPHALAVPDLQYALAKALLASDRVEDAIAQLEEGVTWAKNQKHYDVVQACERLLVHAWRKSGQPGEAVVLLEKIVERQSVHFGADHPSLFPLQHALAAAYEMDQKSLKAVPLLEQVDMAHNKLQGQQHQSQLITLHLLLRSQTSAGQRIKAYTTISRIVGLIKRSKSSMSPLQTLSESADPSAPPIQQRWNPKSRPQTQQPDIATSSIPDSSNDNSTLQRLIDHIISSQPSGASVPRELQDRITAYNISKQVQSAPRLTTATDGPPAQQHTQGLHPPLHGASSLVQSVSATTVANTLVEVSATGAAVTSQSTAIAASAVGVSGTIGMVIAWFSKLYLVDKPQTELMRQTEAREKRKDEEDMDLERRVERREALTAEISQQSERLNIIKGLVLIEEELVRKDANTAERETQLRQISEKLKYQIGELRKQVDAKERERQAEYQDRLCKDQLQHSKKSQQAEEIKDLERKLADSKRFEEFHTQQAEKITFLEQQLRQSSRSAQRQFQHTASLEQELYACRAKLSKAEEQRERYASVARQWSGVEGNGAAKRANEPQNQDSGESEDQLDVPEPEDDRDLSGSAYEMQNLGPANVAAEHTAEETRDSIQSELETARAKIETQQSELNALEEKLIETQRERDESQDTLTARVAACRCGQKSNVEVCLSCAQSHLAIRALREDLSGEDFGGKEVDFLDGLDPSRNANELVPILCERLKGFMQTLYKDLLPLHETNSKDFEAKLGGADAIIADYQDRLAKSQCRESRLESLLKEARSELKEALTNVRERDGPPAQQEPVQQAAPWAGFRWRFG